jgi:hypothetical protein
VAYTRPDAELNAEADWKAGRHVEMSIHDGAPGAAGTDNEASGGGYARVTVAWEAAGDDGPLGAGVQPGSVGRAWAAPMFSLPAGDWTHYAYWDGLTLRETGDLPTTYTLASAGSYQPNCVTGPNV